MGVKDAFYTVVSKAVYNDKFKEQGEFMANVRFEDKDPSWIRKLVEGAVAYAKKLGFNPHPDYTKVRMLFGDIDLNARTEEIEFGKDGKPTYVAGPYENLAKQMSIMDQLTRVCGEGGFEFIAFIQ